MAITLTDLKNATATYVDDEVDVTIPRITSGLEPDEEGTFDLVVTNGTEATGFRLENVVLHVRSQNPGRALLVPPGSALLFPRASTDTDDPRLDTDTPVEEMFIHFQATDDLEFGSTMDPGEVTELELEYHAIRAGAVTITCHVHATVDIDGLFPRQNGRDGTTSVTILA